MRIFDYKRTKAISATRAFRRTQTGSVGILIPSTVLLLVLGVGAFSADVAHNTTVRAQLQSATDAGALAGAAALSNTETAYSAAYNAAQVTGLNDSNGVKVASTSPGTNVQVSIDTNVAGERGVCTVTATQTIDNWLASLFGRPTDVVEVTSTAAASQTVSGVAANMLFPLAVSIDAVPTHKSISQLPLGKLKPGDTFNVYINSQQIKNGAFTSFTVKNTNANWFNDAIDQGLGLKAPTAGFIPPVHIGDQIYLSNGVAGQKRLANAEELEALRAGEHFLLPVIEGTPPYNQSRTVIGWVSVKVKNVETNNSGGEVETIETEIVDAAVRGEKGAILGNSDASATANLALMSPSSVRLIPNANALF